MSSPCQIKRWNLSRALNRNTGLSNQLQQHVDSCESCRQFYRANQSLISFPGTPHRPPNEERQARIMSAVRAEARKETKSPRVLRERASRFGPALAGAVAACLLVVWLAFPPDGSKTETDRESWLQFPGVVNRAAQTQYEAELARLQRDLSRSALFVRSAATPMEILGRE